MKLPLERRCCADDTVDMVLFVCEHGSAKSVVAAAHFNRLAEAKGLKLRAISRGTVPDDAIAPAAEAGLKGDKLDVPHEKPARLAQADLNGALRVISFCELPAEYKLAAPAERWEVPPVSTDYDASRDAMLVNIERLLRELDGK